MKRVDSHDIIRICKATSLHRKTNAYIDQINTFTTSILLFN